jgi:choline dehydrogenase-like flavoprotein
MSDDAFDDEVAAVTFDPDDDSVVVIIGSGAGGGTLAHELCAKGIDVVLLEAGPRYQLTDFDNDEYAMQAKLNWADRRIVQGSGRIARDWPESPTLVVKAVGGSTVHWAAVALRGRPDEFRPRSVYGAIDGADLIDWPLTYADLAPYYAKAEDKLGVTGTNGIPPLPASNNFRLMAAGARQLGYREISPGHMAVNSMPRDGRNACDQIGFCMQGCRSGAKWSTLYSEIPKAESTGHLEVRPRCMALRIEHGTKGKATGVLYVDYAGIQHLQKARVVAIAGNAIETARIMLNSTSNSFPEGLANSSGCVGKYYTRHMVGYGYGVFDKPVNFHRGTTCAGVVEDGRRHDDSRSFAGGYILGAMALGLPLFAAFFAPGAWGREFTADVEAYNHVCGIFANGEDMPMAGNSVTLHPTARDQYDLPVPLITINDHANDVAMRNHAMKATCDIQLAAGARRIIECPPMPGSHNMGTARMSATPRDGVCNQWGQTHDIPNLFVCDGSLFPTSGGGNPTLTIVALAIREADYLAAQMRTGTI